VGSAAPTGRVGCAAACEECRVRGAFFRREMPPTGSTGRPHARERRHSPRFSWGCAGRHTGIARGDCAPGSRAGTVEPGTAEHQLDVRRREPPSGKRCSGEPPLLLGALGGRGPRDPARSCAILRDPARSRAILDTHVRRATLDRHVRRDRSTSRGQLPMRPLLLDPGGRICVSSPLPFNDSNDAPASRPVATRGESTRPGPYFVAVPISQAARVTGSG